MKVEISSVESTKPFLQLYDFFPHYPIKDTISEKKFLNIICVLFSLQIYSEIFLTLKSFHREIIINFLGLLLSISYSCQILKKLELSRDIIEENKI